MFSKTNCLVFFVSQWLGVFKLQMVLTQNPLWQATSDDPNQHSVDPTPWEASFPDNDLFSRQQSIGRRCLSLLVLLEQTMRFQEGLLKLFKPTKILRGMGIAQLIPKWLRDHHWKYIPTGSNLNKEESRNTQKLRTFPKTLISLPLSFPQSLHLLDPSWETLYAFFLFSHLSVHFSHKPFVKNNHKQKQKWKNSQIPEILLYDSITLDNTNVLYISL